MKKKVGIHAIVELYGCSEILLDDIRFVKKVFKHAVKVSGLKCIHEFFHKFNPHGITGFALLTSSHIALHCWPEYKYASLDIFACDRRKKVLKAIKVFEKSFEPMKVKKRILERG